MDQGEFPLSLRNSLIDLLWKGKPRQLRSAIIFSSKEYMWSFPKRREEILCYLEKLGPSSEVTSRPLKEWLTWGELNGKFPNFLIDNLGTKSLMKISVPRTHSLLGTVVPEFPGLQAISRQSSCVGVQKTKWDDAPKNPQISAYTMEN